MPDLRSLSSLLILGAFGGIAAGQQSDQPRWLIRGAPDPAIIRAGDEGGYYVFSTGKGIPILHSEDLRAWEYQGRVFDQAVPAWARQRIPNSNSVWAPDIRMLRGRYHLYYSVSSFGSQRSAIGLAVNATLDPQSPEYRWEDRGMVIESFPDKNDYNAIDPALFVDDDGQAYLFWGSYWTGIKATELDPGTGKPASTQPAGTPVAGRRKGASQAIEAAYVIKRKDHYYLFVSWDFCCAGEQSSYKVMVGRATCPLGPYVDDHGVPLNDGGGRLVLMGDLRWRGPGHNSVLQTAEGDWLVYHAIDAEKSGGGRELQIRPIRWVDDWPTVGPPLTADGVTPAETTAKTSPLVGRWEHVVNSKDRYDIFLEANGLVTGVAGEAAWEQTGNRVQMRWRDPQSPGGFWVDQVTFDPDHQQYSGENQRGVTIRGRRR